MRQSYISALLFCTLELSQFIYLLAKPHIPHLLLNKEMISYARMHKYEPVYALLDNSKLLLSVL
jgi:hypothetical protein